MARRSRCSDAGYVYHVLNRAVGRATIFEKAADYAAFEKILAQASAFAMPVLSYAIMPNHWHLVVKPEHDGTLSKYLQWLTVTHVRRWHSHHHTAGTGPIYQGRFKSFPVQEDDHFLTVCRYVERNARAPTWSREPRTGGGPVYGRVSNKPSLHGWPLGRCSCPHNGRSMSMRPKPKASWPLCASRWRAASPLARNPGDCARPTPWGCGRARTRGRQRLI